MIDFNQRIRAALLLTPIVLASTLSCAAQPDEPAVQADPSTSSPEPEPAYLRISNRWISAYDQLMTADGTFVRAYSESDQAIISGGGRRGVYPGFADADRGVHGIDEYWESRNGYNTAFFGLGRISELEDGIIRATVCAWSGNGGKSGVFYFLDYRREGISPPATQSGLATRPSTNVFGEWYVVDTSNASGDPEAEADCLPLRPVDPVDEGQPPLSPFPGWPAD
ncbi:MAG: hypothetical protein WBA00_13530 [Rhodococcus sp. (in: high G+C Gram-positive bacteria)]